MPRLTRDALVADYRTYGTHPQNNRVGAEFERLILNDQGKQAPYDPTIRTLLRHFVQDGWEAHREGPHLLSAEKDGAWFTLEPGAQTELSGAPYVDLHDIQAEAADFARQTERHLAGTGYRQIALGYTPYADIEKLRFLPKARYGVMKKHMLRSGTLGHHMMKGTAATQASYDFANEADCSRKVQLATAIGPLTTAMFANSPLRLGKPTGFKSFRGYIWTRTDPTRTGLPDAAARFSYERWVDYLLDVPMMFAIVRGEWLDARGVTFRQWMRDGIDGIFPDRCDWELHLTSVFPEVRVKRTIEVRGADCVPLPMQMAFVALVTGLYYDQAALDAGLAIGRRFSRYGSRDERFLQACRYGLEGVVGGKRLADWAAEVVDAAYAGLQRYQPGSAHMLLPLMENVSRAKSPADDVLANLAAGGPQAVLNGADLMAGI